VHWGCLKGSGRGLLLDTMQVFNTAEENHGSKISDTQLSGSIVKPESCGCRTENTNLFIVTPEGENSLYFIKGIILKHCNF
jgi:hypothetical protein